MSARAARPGRSGTATPHRLALAGPQTIREAGETQALLLQALQAHGSVAIDCDAVTATDLAFVQVLLAAGRSAAAAKRRCTLQPPPAGALLDTLRRGGVLPEGAAPDPDPARWASGGEMP